MPRLDNSLAHVRRYFGLKWDPKDPGATPPVDLCHPCATDWDEEDCGVDHPPYQDEGYICCDCGAELTEDDDE